MQGIGIRSAGQPGGSMGPRGLSSPGPPPPGGRCPLRIQEAGPTRSRTSWFPLCRYHLKDVIVGKIYFLLVRIKIKHMEIDIIKRETTGTGPNVYHENDTIAKYEIMDGAPVRGEPARLAGGAAVSASGHEPVPPPLAPPLLLGERDGPSASPRTSQALGCLAKGTP